MGGQPKALVCFQLSPSKKSTPWLKLPDKKRMSESQKLELSLQAAFFASYMRDAQSEDSDPLKSFLVGLRNCASEFANDSSTADIRYKDEIQRAGTIVSKDKPGSATRCYKFYEEALWLTSRLLGTPAALLLGCTARGHQVTRLKHGDYARIISLIAKEKPDSALSHLDDKFNSRT